MPSHFPIYFMSMDLSIQFAAICLRPPYESFTPHKGARPGLRTQVLKKGNKCTSGLH